MVIYVYILDNILYMNSNWNGKLVQSPGSGVIKLERAPFWSHSVSLLHYIFLNIKKWDSDLIRACLNFMALWPRMVWMEQSWMWALYKGFFLLFIVITVIMKLLVNEQLWAKAAIIYIFKLAFFFLAHLYNTWIHIDSQMGPSLITVDLKKIVTGSFVSGI